MGELYSTCAHQNGCQKHKIWEYGELFAIEARDRMAIKKLSGLTWVLDVFSALGGKMLSNQ